MVIFHSYVSLPEGRDGFMMCHGQYIYSDWSADINSKSPSEASSPNLQARAAASLLFPQTLQVAPKLLTAVHGQCQFYGVKAFPTRLSS